MNEYEHIKLKSGVEILACLYKDGLVDKVKYRLANNNEEKFTTMRCAAPHRWLEDLTDHLNGQTKRCVGVKLGLGDFKHIYAKNPFGGNTCLLFAITLITGMSAKAALYLRDKYYTKTKKDKDGKMCYKWKGKNHTVILAKHMELIAEAGLKGYWREFKSERVYIPTSVWKKKQFILFTPGHATFVDETGTYYDYEGAIGRKRIKLITGYFILDN